MIGWISLWKYCYTVNHHPFGCALEGSPRMAGTIKWILYLLAALQWDALIYIGAYSWRSAPGLRLGETADDCLAARLPSAPGISSCPTGQICSSELLFGSFRFKYPGQWLNEIVALNGLFAAFSLTGILMVFGLVIFPRTAFMIKGGSIKKWKEKVSHFDVGYSGSICLAAGVCLLYVVLTGIDAVRTLDHPREGPDAINWDCNALHANLSPWRYYLVVQNGLPVRVARMWFNS